jgi:ribonuclease III
MRQRLARLFSGGKNPHRELEKRIGYRFSRRGLLEAALTHRSFRFENSGVKVDNQRLEFLGDAVLGLLTAAHFYTRFEHKDEGGLTTLRSQLTSGRALAHIARGINLGEYLKVGKGEERSGGRHRLSSLADALEAVVGAAYLDGGMKACQKLFGTLFLPSIETIDQDMWASNPKGKLQEYCQRRWKSGPHYRTVRREGPAHAAVFTAEVTVNGGQQGSGKGPNKQEAETHAAADLLKRLCAGGDA